MSTTASTLPLSRSTSRAGLADYWELTKPRLSLMNVITAALGYFAAGPEISLTVLLSLLAGTALAAFGAGALNMWWERHEDALMARTADRPIPAGRVSPRAALVFGLVLSVSGVAWLALGVNFWASVLTAATVLLYLLAYTPLKKVSPWATELGAIPGALPPLIGWVAAGAGFSGLGWILFAFLFAWQIPHFMAICWVARVDYARGGFAMLSRHDPTGQRVARKAFVWTLLMVAISFLPLGASGLGPLFVVATAALGAWVLRAAWTFWREAERDLAGRRLFLATIAYLPAYLMVLVVDRFLL
ncbi:MAG: heme o synthase [Opitutales bacterium]